MKKVLKNSFLYTLGNLLPQGVNFFLIPLYTAYLSTDDYGITNSMTVLSSLLLIFFTLSLDRSIHRFYYEFEDETERKKYLGMIFSFVLVVSIIFTILILSNKWIVTWSFKSIKFYPYYILAVSTTFFAVFQIIPRYVFQVKEEALKYILFTLGIFITNVALTVYFVVLQKEGAIGLLKALFITNVIFTPVCLKIIYSQVIFHINLRVLKESLQFSLPFIPSLISAFILNMSDRIFIENYLTLSDVGVYSLAYKISSVVGLLGSSFLLAVSPHFYKVVNSSMIEIEAKKSVTKIFNGYQFLLLLVGSLIIFSSKDLIIWLFPEAYSQAGSIIPLIVVSYIFIQLSSVYNLMAYQNKKSTVVMIINISGACLNILLNFLLIPYFGIKGAAIATLISFVFILISTREYAKRQYFLEINFYVILLLLVIVLFIEEISGLLGESYSFLILWIKVLLIATIIYVIYSNTDVIKKLKTLKHF